MVTTNDAIIKVISIFLIYFLLKWISGVLGEEEEWSLVWEEQFDRGNLQQNWNFNKGCTGWGNHEVQCYAYNDTTNSPMKNGILEITAVRKGDTITSARIFTKDAWLYGKFAIRARLPKGNFLWPAFWMMPRDNAYGRWPKSGEIDIMEYRGQRPNEILGTLHLGKKKHGNKFILGSGSVQFPFDFSEQFHEFSLIWNKTGMWWFVDDKMFHKQNLEMVLDENLYEEEGQPFDKPFYIVLNLAVGGDFFGLEKFALEDADSWTKPTFEIDWVRIWQNSSEI